MSHFKCVYIVDDDVEVRKSLFFFLSSAGYFARPSGGGVAFLADVDNLQPGCVLLDMRMPELDGIEVIEALGARIDRFPVVVMTGHGDVSTAVRAMKLGASDFLEKPFAEDVVIETIDRVFQTLRACESSRDERARAKERIDALTSRERDVLAGLAAGLSNKIIAFHLNLSIRTVEMHRANMMDHLAVRTLPDALRLAYICGITGDEMVQARLASDAQPERCEPASSRARSS